jgi:hypothetical protein
MINKTSTYLLSIEHGNKILELAQDLSLSASEIFRQLNGSKIFGVKYDRSLRQTQRYVKDVRGNLDHLDELFEWRTCAGSDDIPWESGTFLLDMWAYIQERNHAESLQSTANSPLSKVTIRRARWWWRVHQAVPNLPNHMDRREFVSSISDRLWISDLAENILGIPHPASSAEEAYLAYRPWEGADKEDIYDLAVQQGRILPLNNLLLNIDEDGGIAEIIQTIA